MAGLIEYNIELKTKTYTGSSDAVVLLFLYGSKGDSGVITLNHPSGDQKACFRQHQTFSVTAPDVGTLTKIKLMHDNAQGGGRTEWVLDFVVVKTKSGMYEKMFYGKKLPTVPKNKTLAVELFPEGGPIEYTIEITTESYSGPANPVVLVSLYGDKGTTGVMDLNHLSGNQSKIFDKTQSFTIEGARIGILNKVKLTHDNAQGGGQTEWVLDSVVVKTKTGMYEKMKYGKALPKVPKNKTLSVELVPEYEFIEYTIELKTTSYTGTSNPVVLICLTGTRGMTGVIPLNHPSGDQSKLFEKRQTFSVKAADVGILTKVKLTHDNGQGGGKTEWVLDSIVVKTKTGIYEKWEYGQKLPTVPVNKTLAVQFLPENKVGALIEYSIELKTKSYSGPSHPVVLLFLYGSKGNTGVIHLYHPSGDQSKSLDASVRQIFRVEAPDVGTLQKVKLLHDNAQGGGKAEWVLDFVVVKTKGLYERLEYGREVPKDPKSKTLSVELTPGKVKQLTSRYEVVIKTESFTGCRGGDPVSLCVFGENGNTGMMNVSGVMFKRDTFLFEGPCVGRIDCLRVVHSNMCGGGVWALGECTVKGDGQNITFEKKTLEKSTCSGRLEGDLYACAAPISAGIQYRVKVSTGSAHKSGTDAAVFINLFGPFGETGKINLTTPVSGSKPFQNGQVDEFTFTACDVGKISHISIGYENDDTLQDPHARWLLETVVVEKTRPHMVALTFTASRWLDHAAGDQKTVVELYPRVADNTGNEAVYHISTKTSDIVDASTDANVFIILYGENGDTGVIQLDALGKGDDLFENGSEDVFTTKAADVGPLLKIRIGHDDQGHSANWHVSSVSVCCPSQMYTTTFNIDRWLSSREGGMETEYDILTTDQPGEKKIVYDVTLMTTNYSGLCRNYGKVNVIIYGESCDTGPLEIVTPKRDRDQIFDKSNKMMYALEGINVGEVKKIKIIHDNRAKVATWKLKFISVKSPYGFVKFPADEWLHADPENPPKLIGVYYPKPEDNPDAKKKYFITFMTKNFRKNETVAPKVYVCLFGDKGNTGMLHVECPENDLFGIFDKNNKQKFQIEAIDVGEITHIRVMHDNLEGVFEWHLQYVQVQPKGGESVKFTANKWMDSVKRGTALQIDLAAPPKCTEGSEATYVVVVKSGQPYTGGDTGPKPYINIHGKHGDTGKLSLAGGQFLEGQEDRFELTAADVGHISKISLGHNHPTASWFVDFVTVKLLTGHVTTTFQAGKFFGASSGDRMMQRDLVPTVRENTALANHVNYHIIVKTANVDKAATDADVYVDLWGDNGFTGKLHLDNESEYDLFERNASDIFTKRAVDVGQLKDIRVSHNNKGRFSDWYLEEISVICPAHGYKTDFVVDKWLKAEAGKSADIKLDPTTSEKK